MSGPNASRETVFPWLPGEAHRLPDPAWTYRNDPGPPKHVMLTLTMLAQDFTPQVRAPAEWIAVIEENALNSPIRAFARKHFGLADVWNEGRQAYDWYDKEAKNADGTAVALPHEAALQRCWSGYAQLLLDDLAQHGETVAQAVERIPRQWREWTMARAAEFVAMWSESAAWPPALALSWIMFGGDWERIAALLENGRDMPTDGIVLSCIGSSLEEDAEGANKRAPQDLMQAFRLRADHPNRVSVSGRLNGQGAMMELGPADLASLEWAMDPNHTLGAVLERYGGEYYSNVLVDAASLVAAFPERPQPAPTVAGEKRAAESLKAAVRKYQMGQGQLPVFAHWQNGAEREFAISGRGARRAWDLAAAEFPELKSPASKPKRVRADRARGKRGA